MTKTTPSSGGRSARELDEPPRAFRVVADGHYRMVVKHLGIQFDLDRIRRDRHELVGELCVLCDLAGASTVDGVLSVADFNVSSIRARSDRAKHLERSSRAEADVMDWQGLVEEFCQRVLAADRLGSPAVSLRDLARPAPEAALDLDGIRLLRHHPVIYFGDGGTAKSYLALFQAGLLVRAGLRVAFVDWELSGDEHRDRLERLFGADMPDVRYVRCDRPLVHELDRLRRVVRDDAVEFAVFDSVAFACDGPPEAAEIASAYFRAVRQLGPIGSLHIAHQTKSGEHTDQRPFGSAFWHNGARATWHVRPADASLGHSLTIGVFPRKANLGPLGPAVGFEIAFAQSTTTIRRADVTEIAGLAERLSLVQRLRGILRAGARTREQIVAELALAKNDAETLRRTINRGIAKGQLIRLPGAGGGVEQIGLATTESEL